MNIQQIKAEKNQSEESLKQERNNIKQIKADKN